MCAIYRGNCPNNANHVLFYGDNVSPWFVTLEWRNAIEWWRLNALNSPETVFTGTRNYNPDSAEVVHFRDDTEPWLGTETCHIINNSPLYCAQAYVVVDDDYPFSDYGRKSIICQEDGHALGLGHVQSPAATCMESPWDFTPSAYYSSHDKSILDFWF